MPVMLLIQMLDGHTVTLVCNLDDVGHAVKRRLERSHNAYRLNFRLILKLQPYRLLVCERTLADHGIADNSWVEVQMSPKLRGGCVSLTLYARLPIRLGGDRFEVPREHFRCCSLIPHPRLIQTLIPPRAEFVACISRQSYEPFVPDKCLVADNFSVFKCHGDPFFDRVQEACQGMCPLRGTSLLHLWKLVCSFLGVHEPITTSCNTTEEEEGWVVTTTPLHPLLPGVYRWQMHGPDRPRYLFQVADEGQGDYYNF